MNNKTTAILLFLLFGSRLLTSQNIQLSTAKVDKLQNFDYFGTDAKYHYFTSTGNQVHRFDKQNLSAIPAIEVKFDNKKENRWSSHILKEKLVIVSRLYETAKTGSTCMMNVYQFDPATGAKIKAVKTGGTGENSLFYECTVDSARKQIIVTINDSIVTLLDYDLEPVSFDKDVKYKRYGDFDLTDLVVSLEKIMQSMNMKGFSFNITTSGTETHVDSTSTKNYIISYESREDKDIPYFHRSIGKVSIRTRKKDSKVKEVEFSLATDKSIIDKEYIEDKDGNLIFIGKFISGTDNYAHYGMFSAKYDLTLNELSPLKYYDLVNTEKDDKSVPNKKFLGLFYTRLALPKYTFNIEDNGTILLFQKEFNNVRDHIYILKIESSSELTFNMVSTHVVVNKKYPLRTESFIPVLLRDKLVFIFYEHPDNLDLSSGDVNMAWCDADKKTSVLVSCNYDISGDDVRKKKVITETADLKPKPHLNEYSLYVDPDSGNVICLVPGENPKNVTKTLYQISLSY